MSVPTLNRTTDDDLDDGTYHVYPTFGREHVTNRGAACWCGPHTEYVEGGKIIIHEVEQ